jgi:hypothetical protein
MPIPSHRQFRITPQIKRAVFCRDGGTCQMCGATTDDFDPCDGTAIRLTVDFTIPPNRGGEKSVNNMRLICSCCSEGLLGIALPKPDRVHLLSQIRRATIDDQEAVLSWLLTKFGMVAAKKS